MKISTEKWGCEFLVSTVTARCDNREEVGRAPRISHMANSSNPIETLCRHAAASLPDSISERKTVLVALEKVLKPQHRVYRDVQANLAALEAAEKLQRELYIHFMPIQPS
jgi:hypothetical protein